MADLLAGRRADRRRGGVDVVGEVALARARRSSPYMSTGRARSARRRSRARRRCRRRRRGVRRGARSAPRPPACGRARSSRAPRRADVPRWRNHHAPPPSTRRRLVPGASLGASTGDLGYGARWRRRSVAPQVRRSSWRSGRRTRWRSTRGGTGRPRSAASRARRPSRRRRRPRRRRGPPARPGR